MVYSLLHGKFTRDEKIKLNVNKGGESDDEEECYNFYVTGEATAEDKEEKKEFKVEIKTKKIDENKKSTKLLYSKHSFVVNRADPIASTKWDQFPQNIFTLSKAAKLIEAKLSASASHSSDHDHDHSIQAISDDEALFHLHFDDLKIRLKWNLVDDDHHRHHQQGGDHNEDEEDVHDPAKTNYNAAVTDDDVSSFLSNKFASEWRDHHIFILGKSIIRSRSSKKSGNNDNDDDDEKEEFDGIHNLQMNDCEEEGGDAAIFVKHNELEWTALFFDYHCNQFVTQHPVNLNSDDDDDDQRTDLADEYNKIMIIQSEINPFSIDVGKEYVTIQNNCEYEPINIAGWKIEGRIDYEVIQNIVIINPNSFKSVKIEKESFAHKSGFIKLYNLENKLVDHVTYHLGSPLCRILHSNPSIRSSS